MTLENQFSLQPAECVDCQVACALAPGQSLQRSVCVCVCVCACKFLFSYSLTLVVFNKISII